MVFDETPQFARILDFDGTALLHERPVLIQKIDTLVRVIAYAFELVLWREESAVS